MDDATCRAMRQPPGWPRSDTGASARQHRIANLKQQT